MATDRTVLIVEDDADTRAALAERIRGDGYTVVLAEHGCEALEWLLGTEIEPCAIVLDLLLPFMSGWELIQILKSYHRLSGIPIIVVSAREPPAEALRAPTRIAYLPKPCDPDTIVDMLDRGVTRSSRRWRVALEPTSE